MSEHLSWSRAQGFRAFKIIWGPIWAACLPRWTRQIVRAAREAVGPDALLMVDAGASDAFWPQDFKWAMRTAHMFAHTMFTGLKSRSIPTTSKTM